jgi:DNA-binding SARP family transcriptional activator/Flp pilus assembly protein TadD
VRLLGSPAIWRGGVAATLPASRKVRALFAYLALAPHAVARSQLCELLWDAPSDPRSELRWSLSKIRGLVDEPERRRVQTSDDAVRLDLSDCFVDAIEVIQAAEAGIAMLTQARLQALSVLFNGDFLEGLEIDRSPVFGSWLTAQRRRFRGCHAAVLEHLAGHVPDTEAFDHLERWLALTPFDRRAHEMLLRALARQNRIREGEQHLAATVRLFEGEGLDALAISQAWHVARSEVTKSSTGSHATQAVSPAITDERDAVAAGSSRRASIAVMPFADRSAEAPQRGGPADALAHDVITRLAKLRSLFVIAQGTVFTLHERRIGPEEAGRMLNVDYVVSGFVRRESDRLTVSVELAETRTARIVWAEIFNQKLGDAFLVLEEIGNRIVASIAGEIETIERNRAILRPPNSLDAWEAHHRGLWHMYRFNRGDNERARHFFEMAVRLDPTFSRAYAGLSFTYFQDVFQGWSKGEPQIDRAFEAAGQSVMVDDRDPAAHWAMGRALWLRERHEESAVELQQAIELSPNFALAHYNLAFVHATAGDPRAAITTSDHSRNLSPFDPMLFGMFGVRAIALVRLGEFGEAADWAVKAASRPNAFTHIRALAAFSLALAGSLDEARRYVGAIHRTVPGYSLADFLGAFRFNPGNATIFRKGAGRIGIA